MMENVWYKRKIDSITKLRGDRMLVLKECRDDDIQYVVATANKFGGYHQSRKL